MKLILDILTISIFCNGWYLITHDGMLFDGFRKKYLSLFGAVEYSDGRINWELTYVLPRFIYKPLFGCIICMASIPGSICYWVINAPTYENLTLWPIACICASVGNYIVYLIIKKLEE